MKKFLVSLFAISLIGKSASCQADDEIRPASLGLSFTLHDYETARLIRATSLSSVLGNKQWSKIRQMNAGIALSYYKGLTRHIDAETTLDATFVNYSLPGKTFSGNGFLLAASASADFKMTTERYWLQPYLSAGIGGFKYREYWGAFVPLGVGLKINLFGISDIVIKSQYRIPVNTDNGAYHFYHSFGFASNIGKKKVVPPPPPPPVPAVEPEPPKDTDGDGITDDQDKCPTVPGLAKYQGCPIPDTDGDGINDEEDKCPTVPGLARYEGCPIPDTDGDGINDEDDKCPTVPGIAELQGCPPVSEEVTKTINYAAKNVYFATNSTKLLSKSFAPLDEVVKVLNSNPKLKLKIDGHTDNTGSDEYNMKLSDGRAASVKDYLISKGIEAERLESEGFGESRPIADNKTATGRQQNRRVEMKVFY